MEYREWLKQLKPGDEVIIRAWNWGGNTYKKANVEKITPTEFIRVCNILYKPQDGNSRSGNSDLLDPNDENTIKIVNDWKKKRFVSEVMYKIRNTDYSKVTYEQAFEICKIMGWGTESE